jgi:hypothetical protein
MNAGIHVSGVMVIVDWKGCEHVYYMATGWLHVLISDMVDLLHNYFL